MRASYLVPALLLFALAGCTSDKGKKDTADAAVAPSPVTLERPDDLPRPPAGRLPDELRPPR